LPAFFLNHKMKRINNLWTFAPEGARQTVAPPAIRQESPHFFGLR